jgi:A/G-specific adenine glycosylase
MAPPETGTDKTTRLRRELLAWYEANKRDLPWRRSRDPYAIWVSEVMLQQTRVAVVIERYQAFLMRFPTLAALAAAPEQEVLALWSGLGYYRRARMLHKAAQFVMNHSARKLPATAAELRLLPGIGTYTAAAIASIACSERIAVVDGNVERVLCRLHGWEAAGTTGAAFRRKVEDAANELVDPERPGDFNQAMMELGATVCAPRNPQCLICPVAQSCVTQGEHKTEPRPRMLSQEVGFALALRKVPGQGLAHREVLLEQRPDSNTVMPGLWQLPALRNTEVPETELHMTVRHAIMQVNYYVRVRAVAEHDVETLTVREGKQCWVSLRQAAEMALTGLTRKVLSRSRLLPEPVALQATAEVR